MNQLKVEFTFDPKALRVIMDTLRELMTDANLLFTQKGLEITGVDPNRLAMINLQLEPTSDMVMNENEEVFFGVYIPFLYKMLRYCNSTDKACFRIFSADRDTMILDMVNEEGTTTLTSQFKNIMIPVDRFPSHENDNEYSSLRMSSSTLGKQLKEVLSISKHVKLRFDKTMFVLYASNENSNVTRENRAAAYFQRANDLVYEGVFMIRYLDKFLKPNLSDTITICFGHGLPLEISHSFDKGSMRMKLSPVTWSFDETEALVRQ